MALVCLYGVATTQVAATGTVCSRTCKHVNCITYPCSINATYILHERTLESVAYIFGPAFGVKILEFRWTMAWFHTYPLHDVWVRSQLVPFEGTQGDPKKI